MLKRKRLVIWECGMSLERLPSLGSIFWVALYSHDVMVVPSFVITCYVVIWFISLGGLPFSEGKWRRSGSRERGGDRED